MTASVVFAPLVSIWLVYALAGAAILLVGLALYQRTERSFADVI